jgi:hypothetical protein
MRGTTRLLEVLLAVALMISGCGMQDSAQYIKEEYALEHVEGAGSNLQKVYRASGQSVPQVAAKIAEESKPNEMSAESSERMFLVYPNQVVHVQRDPEKPEDTLVEVSTHEFVRQHYDPGFLQGFLTASLLTSLFGNNWRSYPPRGYYGYGDEKYRKRYAPGGGYRPPTGVSPSPAAPRKPGGFAPPRSRKGTGRVIRR